MTGTRRCLRVLGLVAVGSLVAVLVALLRPVGASAASGGVEIDLPAYGTGFTTTPGHPLLTLSRMAPGSSGSAVMGIRNPSNAAAELSLKVIDVADDDNGCTPAEAVVDHTCGVGQGDLGAELVFTVESASSSSGPYTQTWSGSAAQLVAGADVGVSVPATGDSWVRFTATLPTTSGNETQTDTFGFGLRVELAGNGSVVLGPGGQGGNGVDGGGSTASQPGGGNGVAGVSTGQSAPGSDQGSQGQGSGLASTGASLFALVTAGVLLLASGVLLLLAARMRRTARRAL